MVVINLTTNLKLGKPTSDEKYNVQVQNANMDILDESIKKLQDSDTAFATKEYVDSSLSKINLSELNAHTSNNTIHITSTERNNWNNAKIHANSSHARTDATRTEASSINGNVKINGAETIVYTHPNGTNPHGTTKSDIGLSNVPNVTTNDQTPTFSENSTRVNIASGEKLSVILGKIKKWFSDLKAVAFSGSYNDLKDKPAIPSAYDDTGLKNLINTKVTSVSGKGLSTNDYTTAEKQKLAGIAAGAQPNSGTFYGNATSSNVAAQLGRSGNTGTPMTFHWSGQAGYPDWYWGGSDGTNMYVYRPVNLPFLKVDGNGEVIGSLPLASGVGIHFKSNAMLYSDASQKLIIAASSESNYQLGIGVIESAWAFCPWNSNGYVRLGSPSRKWAQIYSTVASISTSDRREKTDIKDINYNDIKNFLRELRPVYYHLIKNPGKEYAGLIAQEVEQAMIKHNIPEDFGLLDKYPAYDDEGNETGDYIYGLCYEQLITLLLVVVQNELLAKDQSNGGDCY